MNLGENIRFYRKKKSYTQKQLAELSGVATITIQQYEANKREPKVENIQKIALALNVSINDLMGVKPINSVSDLPQEMFDRGEMSVEITFSTENFTAAELDKLREYSEFLKYLRTNTKPPTTE